MYDTQLTLRPVKNGWTVSKSWYEGESNNRRYKDETSVYSTYDDVIEFVKNNPFKE